MDQSQEVGEVIALAASLEAAEEHREEIKARIEEIKKLAPAHLSHHDLAKYVGNELEIETRFVEQALKHLHPSPETTLAIHEELGIKDSYFEIRRDKVLQAKKLFKITALQTINELKEIREYEYVEGYEKKPKYPHENPYPISSIFLVTKKTLLGKKRVLVLRIGWHITTVEINLINKQATNDFEEATARVQQLVDETKFNKEYMLN